MSSTTSGLLSNAPVMTEAQRGWRPAGIAMLSTLSLREVELIQAARGVVVSYESIREGGLRFGRLFANTLKRRRPRRGDKGFLDEVFIRIRGKLQYLWRAVDHPRAK